MSWLSQPTMLAILLGYLIFLFLVASAGETFGIGGRALLSFPLILRHRILFFIFEALVSVKTTLPGAL